jgi:MFS transporter, MHS family, alpha-ketoglutarate permease
MTGGAPGPASRRTLVAIGAGNAMEWFDWNIYATYSTFLAAAFFLGGDPGSDLLKTLAVFAVGFVARPFGGLLFGWLADRRGRKTSMTLSVATASLGSLVIGLCPSAHTIGLAAPVLLLVARLAQGLAHGGELPSSQTYLAELAPRERRGLWSSLIYVSGTIGVLAGTLLAAVSAMVLDHAQMQSWGWRIGFLLGAAFGLYTLYMRARMAETEVFSQAEEAGTRELREPLWRAVLAHPRQLLRILGLTVGLTVVYYVWGVAAPAYAIGQRHTPAAAALWAGSAANVVFIVALPLWGILSDRFGRRPVLVVGGIGSMVLFLPLQGLIQGQSWQLFVAMALALVFVGPGTAVGPAVMAELFPTGVRAAGVGVPYSVAVALFGGTAPYLQAFFAQRGAPTGFGWYAIALAAVSTVTALLIPETRARDLTEADRPEERTPA